jgi:hypothetical protein
MTGDHERSIEQVINAGSRAHSDVRSVRDESNGETFLTLQDFGSRRNHTRRKPWAPTTSSSARKKFNSVTTTTPKEEHSQMTNEQQQVIDDACLAAISALPDGDEEAQIDYVMAHLWRGDRRDLRRL